MTAGRAACRVPGLRRCRLRPSRPARTPAPAASSRKVPGRWRAKDFTSSSSDPGSRPSSQDATEEDARRPGGPGRWRRPADRRHRPWCAARWRWSAALRRPSAAGCRPGRSGRTWPGTGDPWRSSSPRRQRWRPRPWRSRPRSGRSRRPGASVRCLVLGRVRLGCAAVGGGAGRRCRWQPAEVVSGRRGVCWVAGACRSFRPGAIGSLSSSLSFKIGC